jgi:hypothetical protein
LHDSDVAKFLMKQMKLSLKTNYLKIELFYFKQQTKTPSPSKLATATSIAKKTYNESFKQVNCQIHLSVIPFLTPMNVIKTYNEQLDNAKILQPYVAPVNHNTLTSAKTLQIVHTLMGNYCHGDQTKKSQFEDMGNDACLLIRYYDMVRALMYVQIILYWNNLLIQLFIIWMMIWMTTIP